jgi:hypothetical protein
MLGVVLLGAALFAKPPTAAGKRKARHWLLGLVHGLAHVGLAAAGTWVWLQLPMYEWSWPWPVAAAALLYWPVAGLVATELAAAYLLVAGAFGVNVNELFAGQSIEDAKSFVRLHIAADGTLTVYPVAVDRICREWRANPEGDHADPWIEPRDPLRARLAEEPYTVG